LLSVVVVDATTVPVEFKVRLTVTSDTVIIRRDK